MMFAVFLSAVFAVAVAVPFSFDTVKIDAEGCGKRPLGNGNQGCSRVSPYIVGGQTVNPPFSYPWMCSLQENYSGVFYHTCGGSLIKNKYGKFFFITAAHCVSVYTLPFDRAVCGIHYNNIDPSHKPHAQVFRFGYVFVHEGYNPNTFDNDLAIMTLDHQPQESDYVSAVCLPNSVYTPGECGTVTGWGRLQHQGSTTNILHEVSKPIADDYTCSNAYGYNFIPKSMLCASSLGKDACQGDSGGPFVTERNGTYELTGVVSWGWYCADPRYPGVYTNIVAMKPFINKVINGWGA